MLFGNNYYKLRKIELDKQEFTTLILYKIVKNYFQVQTWALVKQGLFNFDFR